MTFKIRTLKFRMLFFRVCFVLIFGGCLIGRFAGMPSMAWAEKAHTNILFLGDSITAGLGVELENELEIW